jgi:putative transposase
VIRKTYSWNHKRIERVYSKLALSECSRSAKGPPIKDANKEVKTPNVTWTIGTVDETYCDGTGIHAFQALYALGGYPHEVLGMEVDRSFPVRKITCALKFFIKHKGTPTHIIFWEAKERQHSTLANWCKRNGIRATFSVGFNPFRKYFERKYVENVSMKSFAKSMKEGASFIEHWFLQYNSCLP